MAWNRSTPDLGQAPRLRQRLLQKVCLDPFLLISALTHISSILQPAISPLLHGVALNMDGALNTTLTINGTGLGGPDLACKPATV